MSTNRFTNLKPRLDDHAIKDLTPKSSKYSPKTSPVFSSLRSGLTLKPDPINKIRLAKPSTSKNSH